MADDGWVEARLPVPTEYAARLLQVAGEMPMLGTAEEITLGGFSLGEWTVQGVEWTWSGKTLGPVLWVTLGRRWLG